jgi:cobalamin-dependent methionine synthase I
LAGRLVKKIEAAGVPVDDLSIDALLYLLSDDPKSAAACDDGEQIMEAFPGVDTFYGLSHISYGMPYRWLINQIFPAPAATHGRDSSLMNPTDRQIYQTLKSAPTVMGRGRLLS